MSAVQNAGRAAPQYPIESVDPAVYSTLRDDIARATSSAPGFAAARDLERLLATRRRER